MKFGNWKRLKEFAQKAAQVASKGARIGGKIIKYARPAIDAVADFVPGGAIIKKGTEYIDAYSEPVAKMLDDLSTSKNVIQTLKTGVNDIVKKNPTETMKRLNNVIQYNIPEDIFGKPVNEQSDEDIGEF